jgi:ribosomal protein S18 acetylase RimI-like enzyme
VSERSRWQLALAPLTNAAAWREQRVHAWSERNRATGLYRDEEAQWLAEDTLKRLLGQSPSTMGVVSYDVHLDGQRAGECWLHVEPEGRTRRASLWEIALADWDGVGASDLVGSLLDVALRHGASGLEVRVFRGESCAAHLVETGHLHRISSRMVRRLDNTTAFAPSGLAFSLDLMTLEEFEANRDHLIAEYASSMVRAGIFDPDEALADARRQTVMMLPRGLNTPSHTWFVVRCNGERVGTLWLHESVEDGSGSVFDIEIDDRFRRHGIGREVMIAAEEFFRQRNLRYLELHVFGYNSVARDLYSSLGYVCVEDSYICDPGSEFARARTS